MEQIAVSFTDGWVPKTWLTPLATIIDLNGNVMVENGECKELGYWWYIYSFDRYSPEKVYLYVFDGGEELSSDYDRYRFGGNELDAYSNKYSWGRTAAPYFTSVNGRFDKVDKSIRDAIKSRKDYDDKEVRKGLAEIKKEIKGKGW
jgi:C4-type Zn-finger protein